MPTSNETSFVGECIWLCEGVGWSGWLGEQSSKQRDEFSLSPKGG